MPEYLAPGVYVEETSFRAKSIEGVGTSTTAFVGPTRKGPFRADDDTPETPELLTSYGDFERIYGGFADLGLGAGVPATNYLAHAVLAFFNEGGSRLYVSRVVGAGAAAASGRRPRRRGRRTGGVRRAVPGTARHRTGGGARGGGAGLGHDDGHGPGRHAAAHRSAGGPCLQREGRQRLAAGGQPRRDLSLMPRHWPAPLPRFSRS